MCYKCERIRRLDYFGAPIGLTFDSNANYKTRVGGVVTLLICILFGGNLLSNLVKLFTERQFKENTVTHYNQFSSNLNDAWNLSTDDQTLAGMLELNKGIELPDDLTVDQMLRIQFYSVSMLNGTKSYTWHSAVKCNDKYPLDEYG